MALGFSGGVDSSYLLYAGHRAGADIRAYFVKTAFQPDFELRDARRLAEELGASLTVLEEDIFRHAHITANPPERCYACKRVIFGTICERAAAEGYPLVIDGSNASDNAPERPGMLALRELSVRSPLRECGLTKDDVRRLSKEAGLFTWDKPAYACLATRIPSGHTIAKDLLERVEKAENALFCMGFRDFRLRVVGEMAKLQVPERQIEAVFAKKGEILSAIEPYFHDLCLDLKGR